MFKSEEPDWLVLKPAVQDQWGLCTHSLAGHDREVMSIAFSSDGRWLASASLDNTVKIWDAKTGTRIHNLTQHTAGVRSVAFAPDNRLLASAATDETIILWDTASGTPVHVLNGHGRSVNSVIFAPDGLHLASASTDQTIRFWDASSGEPLRTMRSKLIFTYFGIAYSHDGKWIASACGDGFIRILEVATKKGRKLPKTHENVIHAIDISYDSRFIASGSLDRTAKISDSETGNCIKTLKHELAVFAVKFTPDGNQVVTGSADKTIKIWDKDTGACVNILTGHSLKVCSVALSPDSRTLASGSLDGVIKLWDGFLEGQHFQASHGHHGDSVHHVAVSSDGLTAATSSSDRTVKLWNTTTGECLHTLAGHEFAVTSTAFSPDSRLVASASPDRTLKLWRVADGHCIETLRGHLNPVHSVAFSPNGKLLVSASDDQTVRIWDLATDEMPRIVTGKRTHDNPWGLISTISPVAFSPNNELIACATQEKRIMLWNIVLDRWIMKMDRGESDPRAISFTLDGQSVAASYVDSIKLWDTTTGQCTRTFECCKCFDFLSFHPGDNSFHTEIGRYGYEIRIGDRHEDGTQEMVSLKSQGYGLTSDGTYITWNEKKLLRLPPDSRPYRSAVFGSLIVLGCVSGCVQILRLGEDMII